jgi:ABC-2 type transport system permease protein
VKLARDTWLTLQYEVGLQLRSPVTIVTSLFNPVAFLLFFTPFLKSVLHEPSYRDAFQVYVPSLLCITGLMGGLFAGFALLAAMREGVITRFRVTPLSRLGLLLGRQLRVVVLIGFQAAVITVMALVLGLRLPPANFLLALILLAMMVLLGVSISYALAMIVPGETTLGNLTNGVAQPVLIPLSVAPLWIRDVALWNPFAWAANGMQAIFLGHIGAQVVWQATVILAGVAAVAAVLSSRLFIRDIA